MSYSVPSESSTALVHFSQARPDSLWADAGHGSAAFGTSLDRLFGEPGDIHVASLADQTNAHVTTPALFDDPLVLMTGLSDGLILPLADGWYWDLDKAGWVVDHAHA